MKFTLILITSFYYLIGMMLPLKAIEPVSEPATDRSVWVSQSTRASYESSDGQFAIQFPGQPEARMRTVPIAGQSYDWTIFRLQNEAGFYGVAYTDLTAATIELGATAVIDSIENTLTDEFNWSALNGRGKSTEVDGYPAREIIGTQNNQLSVIRLVLADQRLYAVMSSSENLTEMGQFIDSFAVQPWQPYVSESGGFSVNFPLLPTDETESIELGGTEWAWQVIAGRNFTAPDDSYSVGYTDVSSEDLQAGEEELLNRVGTNLLERWQPQNVVESGREISLNGNPGRSFVGTTPEGQIIAVRFYLVGQRMYGVGALSDNVVNISRFLDSFAVR
ncbi:hypothetical protein [Egbenema bharatensis]|uniref:hypothetical protein n=1 Tax=Egbenema bharatensis TaxID=3463334 RepID=UPI003A89CCC7